MATRNTSECLLAFLVLLFAAMQTVAQHETKTSRLTERVVNNTSEIIEETEKFIEEHLDNKDSIYISPNIYNLTIMPQFSYNYEYYRFTSEDREQSMTLVPDINGKFGIYIGWRWIFLGYSFNIDKGNPQKDINLSFYTSRLGIDLFYRKRDKGYKLRSIRGFEIEGKELEEYNRNFDGLSVKQKGFNLYYIFNHRKFSYPAAYSQSTNQRRSAGSFILGVNYNEQSFSFDHTMFGPEITELLKDDMKFRYIKYKDFSINFGYSYNWVFAKNCLANVSLTPAVGYKNTSLKMKNSKEFFSNLNLDFISRLAIVYNNSKYYAGASVVAHTYSYNNKSVSIINGFGVVNIYIGFNFWRRKQAGL